MLPLLTQCTNQNLCLALNAGNGGVIPRLTVTDDNSITVLLPEKRKSDDSLETLLTNFNRSRSHIVQRVLQSVQLFTSEDESLHMNIFTFEPEAGSSAQRQKPIFEEAQMLFDRVKGTETPLVELKMDAANSKHGTVFIAAPNVIKTLALMRATRVWPNSQLKALTKVGVQVKLDHDSAIHNS